MWLVGRCAQITRRFFSSGVGGAVGAALVRGASLARATPSGLTTKAALGTAYGLPGTVTKTLMSFPPEERGGFVQAMGSALGTPADVPKDTASESREVNSGLRTYAGFAEIRASSRKSVDNVRK